MFSIPISPAHQRVVGFFPSGPKATHVSHYVLDVEASPEALKLGGGPDQARLWVLDDPRYAALRSVGAELGSQLHEA
eukprot:341707-Pyramimonas_sp.AAC.1